IYGSSFQGSGTGSSLSQLYLLTPTLAKNSTAQSPGFFGTTRRPGTKIVVMSSATDLVVALTGASGAPYGVRLLDVLIRAGRRIHVTLSPAAAEVLAFELDRQVSVDSFTLRDLLGDTAALG